MTQQAIPVVVVIAVVVSAHVLRKIMVAAQIFPQEKREPFTVKTASGISMVQTVSRLIKKQKARKK